MLVVAGPTGAGKTTTLYAALSELDSATRNITTIEDPVEYRYENINQVQINRLAGTTFANGLKAILRQDPDIILVGEVRDVETAQIAIQSALTGHLVLCSMHAADLVGAIHRFMDMGIEPYLVASALIGVVAQRLVRLVCERCASSAPATPAEAAFYESVVGSDRRRACPRPWAAHAAPAPGFAAGWASRMSAGRRPDQGAHRRQVPAHRDDRSRRGQRHADPSAGRLRHRRQRAHHSHRGDADRVHHLRPAKMIQAASAEPRRMQLYDYTAVNPDGSVLKGLMEASDPEAVWHAISVRGLRPTGVKAHSRGRFGGFLDQLTKVKLQEVVVFCRQLSTFVRVGIPLTTGLETIAEGAGNKRMRQACASMVADLERGGLLSSALARHPQVFPGVLADLIKASETTGHIDDTLVRSADHFERELQTRTRIRGALHVPGHRLLHGAGGRDRPGRLRPPPIQAALRAVRGQAPTDRQRSSRLLLLRPGQRHLDPGRAPGGHPGHRLLRAHRGRQVPIQSRTASRARDRGDDAGGQHRAVLPGSERHPLRGRPRQHQLLGGGGEHAHPVYRRALRDVGEQVAIGESFSRSLRKTSLFPPLVVQMVKVGEDTGTLDQHLAETARMYDSELDNRLKRLTSIVEPLLIISVGTVVGLVRSR